MKYVLATICALALLFLMWTFMPSLKANEFFVLSNAQWFEPNARTARLIPGAGPLVRYNADLKICCIGRYVLSASSAQIMSKIGNENQPISLFFPAIGGNFRLRINDESIALPDDDFSSIGPIVPLKSDWLRAPNLEVVIDLLGPGAGFAGIWKAPIVIGPHFAIESRRKADWQYQVALPAASGCVTFFFSLVFAWMYVSTGRQFEFYRLFAISLVPIGLFDFYLAGIPRTIEPYWGSVTHYGARCLAAIGILFLVTSYLSWSKNQARFSKKVRNGIVRTQLVLAIIACIGSINSVSTFDVAACAAGALLGFAPVFAWRLDNTKVRSLAFVFYVVVLTAALGSVADSIKLVGLRSGFQVPYQYFNRYTAPLLVSQTILIYLAHFMQFFHQCREQAAIISGQRALTTAFQMIVHDIRAPFSRMELGLRILDKLELSNESKLQVDMVRKEVDRSLRSANGILSDVLEIGRTSASITKAESIEKLFADAFLEVSILRNRPEIKKDSRSAAEHLVEVDDTRIKRALINLIDNAFQAMSEGGRIWLATKDTVVDGISFVEVTIGNEHSFIPADRCEKIFDAFQTFGKRGGTGLGLAIAKKAVESHGGKIWCRSSVQRGTEFVFLLPSAAG